MGNRKSRIKAPPRGPKSRDNGALEDWDASSPTPSHHYTQEIPIPELDSNQQPPPPPFARNLSDSERSLAANLLRAACQPPWLRGKRRCLVCCDLDFRRGEDGFSPGGKARCFAHIGELSLAVRQGCPGCRFLWTVVFTLLVLNPEGINFSPNDPMSICGVVLESLVEGGPLAIIWTDGFINKLRDRITDPMRRIEVYVPGEVFSPCTSTGLKATLQEEEANTGHELSPRPTFRLARSGSRQRRPPRCVSRHFHRSFYRMARGLHSGSP